MSKGIKKEEIKNPLPKELKITFAFDVSTTSTGYALLLNDKPMQLRNGKLSIGQIGMRKQEEYQGQVSFEDRTQMTKNRDIKYENFGDLMYHGSYKPTELISNMVYECIAPINQIIGELKTKKAQVESSKQTIKVEVPKIKEFNIVYEVSEIPNGKYGATSQAISSVRKLALYTGYIMYAVSNVIRLAGYHFADEAVVKLVPPRQWQDRLWTIDEADQAEVQGMKGSKVMSIKFANKYLKELGLDLITTQDDMADAINIALLASELKDNVVVRSNKAKRTKKVNITLNRDILKVQQKINEYLEKAQMAKNEFVDNVVWANTVSVDELIERSQRAKRTKYIKYSIEDTRAMELESFLTPGQIRKLQEWKEQLEKLQAELKGLRNGKVQK